MPTPSPTRRLVYGLLVTVAVFVSGELGLRAAGVEAPDSFARMVDQGFSAQGWLRRRDGGQGPWLLRHGARVRTNTERLHRGVHALDFTADPQGRTRVVALGGSTTLGERGFERKNGFVEVLQAELRQARPAASWELLNLGVAGMDSSGLPALAEEALQYTPAALLVYTGNNELQGRLLDDCTARSSPMSALVDRLLLLRLLRAAVLPAPDALSTDQLIAWQERCVQDAVDHVIAEGTPPEAGRRADRLARATLSVLDASISALVELTGDADIPLLLAVPPVRLDHPPDGARPTAPVDAAERFARGQDALAAGDLEGARALLAEAADWDYAARRVTPFLQERLRAHCGADHVVCVDLQPVFDEAAAPELPGSGLFSDACHPSKPAGVRTIARALAPALLQALPAAGRP